MVKNFSIGGKIGISIWSVSFFGNILQPWDWVWLSLFLVLRHECVKGRSSLVLLLVELVDNDANKKVECEEASEDDEEDKVHVHVDAALSMRLFV